jgi:ketosteroid isomerase-like protein
MLDAVAVTFASTARAAPRIPGDLMFPQTFDAAFAASHDALRAMGRGDPAPSQRQYSRRGDEALSNPVSPPIVGHDDIAKETARVAAGLSGGFETFDFEEVVRFVTPDLGYVLGFERAIVRRVGSDAATLMALRVTTVFRREPDGWKLVLRFADRNGIDGVRPDRSNVGGLSPLESGTGETISTPDFDTAAVAVNQQVQRTMSLVAKLPPAEFQRMGSIWSHRDDVTLANPLGPPIVGWANIRREAWAVAVTNNGDATTDFEELTRVVTPDLGFTLGYERVKIRQPGNDEARSLNLRLVTIYRREEEGWKRVLRHADRLPAA